jgi:hypothetical protein
MQVGITNTFTNTGQPVFELIELQIKTPMEITLIRYRFVVVAPITIALRLIGI